MTKFCWTRSTHKTTHTKMKLMNKFLNYVFRLKNGKEKVSCRIPLGLVSNKVWECHILPTLTFTTSNNGQPHVNDLSHLINAVKEDKPPK